MKLRSDMQCIAAVESGMSETCNMRIYIRDAGPLFEDDEFQGLIDMKISSSEELGDVEGVIVQLTGDIVSFRPGTNIHMHSSFGAVRIAFDREHLPVQGQGQREGTMRLKAGTHTLPFKIPVPAGIPPSYFYNNSGDGIHYSIKAVVLRPTKNKKMRQALQFATKAAAKAAFGKEAGYNFSDISDDVVAEPSALEVYNVTVAGERRWDAGTPVPARVMQVTAPHVSSWCTKVGQPIVYMAAAASIGGAEVIVDDEDPDR